MEGRCWKKPLAKLNRLGKQAMVRYLTVMALSALFLCALLALRPLAGGLIYTGNDAQLEKKNMNEQLPDPLSENEQMESAIENAESPPLTYENLEMQRDIENTKSPLLTNEYMQMQRDMENAKSPQSTNENMQAQRNEENVKTAPLEYDVKVQRDKENAESPTMADENAKTRSDSANVESHPSAHGHEGTRKKISESDVCDDSSPRSKFCDMKGDIRIHGKNSTVYIASLDQEGFLPEGETWKIRPYARKEDTGARELQMKPLSNPKSAPDCSVIYDKTPGVVFTLGWYTANFFHSFTDVLIPLYITSRHFQGDVQILVGMYQPQWIRKYYPILRHLTDHEIIDLDGDDQVRCFRYASVGIKYHKELGIDPSRSPNGITIMDFISFLRSALSMERSYAIRLGGGSGGGARPRLLIVDRKKSRTIRNIGEVAAMARGLDFDVVVLDHGPSTPVDEIAQVVNSGDVLVGVHGAGLTNLLFLPTNGVVVQLLPFGDTEWVSENCFEEPTRDMKLRYLKYKVQEEESSLRELYPQDDPVLRDPSSISKQGWFAFWSIYLEKQNITLNVNRFRETLVKALSLLHE